MEIRGRRTYLADKHIFNCPVNIYFPYAESKIAKRDIQVKTTKKAIFIFHICIL